MHVVLSGYYGFDNVGDEAILYAIIQELRKVDPQIDMTVLSNNPEQTRATYGVGAVNRWNRKAINHVLKNTDGLISGGGSLLQDETSIKSIIYYTGIMLMAKAHKKPVFIYAQGMGPISKSLSKWLVKIALNRAAAITVRDADSKRLLEELGIKKASHIVPDPVLGLYGQEFSNDWVRKQDFPSQGYLAVSVRDWKEGLTFKNRIAKSLDELVAVGYAICFVPMHGNHDFVASKETAALMTEKSYIAPAHATIEEKISMIGGAKALIGLRLHALIFASIQATPFIALSYDPKIDAFADIFDQPVVGHVEENDWDADNLLAAVEHVLANRDEESEKISAKAEQLQKEASQTAQIAIDVFS